VKLQRVIIQTNPALNMSGVDLAGCGNMASAGDQKDQQCRRQIPYIQNVQTYSRVTTASLIIVTYSIILSVWKTSNICELALISFQ
jgi:hypothetical protein